MRRWLWVTIVSLLPTSAAAQTPSTGDIAAEVRADFKSVADYVVRSAEKMPEGDYAFRPSPEVRSFAQQIAHIADDQYNLCAPARGEERKAAYRAIEQSLSTKADLVPVLKAAFDYCDVAYAALSTTTGAALVSGSWNRTKFGMLNWNVWHTWEHYGNLVVYLRLKGLVPPSSETNRSVSSAAATVPRPPLFDRLAGHWVLQGTIADQQTTHDVDAELVLNGEYIRMHEVSREKTAGGVAAYEAIVLVGWDEKAGEYRCLWLDTTGAGGLVPDAIASATPEPDRLPFVFRIGGDVFRTTFIYDSAHDSWRWMMDADERGTLRPFARVTLTRRQ